MNLTGLRVQESAGIHTARGSVRDGLAALQNFENLLRSPRVGLRSLGRMIGELRASCLPISTSLGVLIGELALRQPAAVELEQLWAFAQASVRELDEALVRADRRDFGAKVRLALEGDVRRVSGELGALRTLIDLLEAATRARMTELEPAEMVGAAINAMAPDDAAQGPIVHVRVALPAGASPVMTDARVGMQLVQLGIGLVAAAGARFIQVRLHDAQPERAQLAIAPCARSEGAAACLVPTVIAPTLPCCQLACKSLGAAFALDGQGARLCLPARGSSSCGGQASPTAP